jgi:hypothetical protein
MKRIDSRIVIGAGFALFAASNFMNIHMTNDYAANQLLWPNVVRAIGPVAGLVGIEGGVVSEVNQPRIIRRWSAGSETTP